LIIKNPAIVGGTRLIVRAIGNLSRDYFLSIIDFWEKHQYRIVGDVKGSKHYAFAQIWQFRDEIFDHWFEIVVMKVFFCNKTENVYAKRSEIICEDVVYKVYAFYEVILCGTFSESSPNVFDKEDPLSFVISQHFAADSGAVE
jgi:hypothetical protein